MKIIIIQGQKSNTMRTRFFRAQISWFLLSLSFSEKRKIEKESEKISIDSELCLKLHGRMDDEEEKSLKSFSD